MSNPAELYESYMVPALFGPWASHLIESANPKATDHVLDLACGTGIVARQVAARVGAKGAVTGFDVSPNMLAVARATADRDGLPIEWREGKAESLPFPAGSFDLVLCQFGLMFFADQPAALVETHRVLNNTGRLLLSTWQGLDRHPFYQTLHTVIQERLGISALQDIFSLGDADKLRTLLGEGAGFRCVKIAQVSMEARFPDPAGFLKGEIDVDTAAIPAMQQLDSQERKAIIEAISEEMKLPLSEVTKGDYVVLAFHAHVAYGER